MSVGGAKPMAFGSRTLPLTALLVALFLLGPAHAEAGFDMSTMTCQDWIDASDDEQELMIAWLRGYMAGRSTSTLYDPNKAIRDRNVMVSYCQANRTIGVVNAANRLPH